VCEEKLDDLLALPRVLRNAEQAADFLVAWIEREFDSLVGA
jgi:hypothetical protein